MSQGQNAHLTERKLTPDYRVIHKKVQSNEHSVCSKK